MLYSASLLSVVLFTGIIHCINLTEILEPPKYYSKFDWQEKLLEKTVKTDIQMQEYVRQMDKALDSIKVHKEEFEAMKSRIEETVEDLKTSIGTQLEQVIQNVTQLQERTRMPVVLFSARHVRDTSPEGGQVIVFYDTLQNIGDAYDPVTGIFTAPVSGTYLFSIQACTQASQFARFQLVAESSDNIILAISHYTHSASYTTSSDSVAHHLTEGQRVWVVSYHNSGSTTTLYDHSSYCWNHFFGVLLR